MGCISDVLPLFQRKIAIFFAGQHKLFDEPYVYFYLILFSCKLQLKEQIAKYMPNFFRTIFIQSIFREDYSFRIDSDDGEKKKLYFNGRVNF